MTEGRRIKLAMGQMLVEGGRLQENLARAVEMIDRSSRQGCQIVVLPECLEPNTIRRPSPTVSFGKTLTVA